MFEESASREAASLAPVAQPIAEVEQLCNGSQRLLIRRHAVEDIAAKTNRTVFPVYLHVTAAQFTAILQAVRQIVLEWTVDLEKRGVLGEGLQFQPKEKQAAKEATHAFQFSVASGGIVQLQYGEHSTQTAHASALKSEDIGELLQTLKASSPPTATAVDLATLIAQLQQLSRQPNPPKSAIRETLITIKDLAAAGTGAAALAGKASELLTLFM